MKRSDFGVVLGAVLMAAVVPGSVPLYAEINMTEGRWLT